MPASTPSDHSSEKQRSFGTKTHDSFLVHNRTKQPRLFVIGAGREEELVGVTVLRSSTSEGNPHSPLSLIIFPCGVVRDPIKLPVVALKAFDAAIVQVPHQHSLAHGAALRGRNR